MAVTNELKPDAPPAAASKTAQAPAAPKKIPPLMANELTFAEMKFSSFFCVAPAGVSPEELSGNFTFWQNVATKDLQPFSNIRVVSKDASWLGDYVVADCGTGYADVRLLHAMKLPPRSGEAARLAPEGYSVVRADPDQPDGYFGIRNRDRLPMTGRHDNAENALRELLDHAIFRNDQTGQRYLPR